MNLSGDEVRKLILQEPYLTLNKTRNKMKNKNYHTLRTVLTFNTNGRLNGS